MTDRDIDAATQARLDSMTTQEPRTGVQVEPLSEEGLPDRVIVDQHGHYWRDFETHLSMCPVSEENTETTVAAVFARMERPAALEASIDAVADALNAWDQGGEPRPDTHQHWAKIVAALASKSGSETVPVPWSVEQVAAALREAIHDTLYHNIAIPDGRWYWQTEDGTPNDLANAVMSRLGMGANRG